MPDAIECAATEWQLTKRAALDRESEKAESNLRGANVPDMAKAVEFVKAKPA
jgi:hypothetical protein